MGQSHKGAVTGRYNAKPSIEQRRKGLKYRVNTTSTTASGVVPIKGATKYPEEPTIYFTREAWVKQCHLVKVCSKEVGWFALVDYDDKDNSFTITELVIPTQEVTGTETDIGKEDLADAAMELIEQGKDTSKMYAWFHSHVNMGVSPSGQDEYQVEDFLDDLADQPEVPAFIRGIQNKAGDLKLDVYYIQHGVAYQNLTPYILYDDDPAWYADIEAQVKAKVTERTYQSYGNYGWNGGKKYGGGKSGGNGGGSANGFRDGFPGYNGYDYTGYEDVYDYTDDEKRQYNLGADKAASDDDRPSYLPQKLAMDNAAVQAMELVYMASSSEEVYQGIDGELYVCDQIGDFYYYDEYVEFYGDVGESTAGQLVTV